MQKRIIVATLLSVAIALATLGIISYFSVTDSIERSIENRLRLASIIADYTDSFLKDNLTRLYDISLSGAVDFRDGTWKPEEKALRAAYQYSVFSDGVFLLDLYGNVLLSHPPGRQKENMLGMPGVREALEGKKAVVSDIYTIQQTGKKTVFVFVPLMDRMSNIVGLAAGEMNPTNYLLSSVVRAVPEKTGTYIEVVDSRGTVIASNNPSAVFTCSDHDRFLNNLIAQKKTAVTTCHRCHDGSGGAAKTEDILAFSPLSVAPWGVSVREPESAVFAPSRKLRSAFIFLGLIYMVSAFVFAVGVTNSIVAPIKSLIKAAWRIARGNLNEPISSASSRDEIGLLSESFETMRVRLKESLESIQGYNVGLEKKVAERTAELLHNRKRLAILLEEVIKAQEDERKRVARELHDETSQTLAALGISIDIAGMALKEQKLTGEGLEELKERLAHAVGGINRLIKDLRPPVLDDLGFESSVRWLLERHLGEKDIDYHITVTDAFRKAMPYYSQAIPAGKTELILFRVIQEAVINIARHAYADEVHVILDFHNSRINILIEDDGMGFDTHEVMAASGSLNGRFGVLGMKERISLLDGELTVCSAPGVGTSVTVSIPWTVEATDV